MRGVFHQSMSESGKCIYIIPLSRAKTTSKKYNLFTRHFYDEEISLWHTHKMVEMRMRFICVCVNDDGKANISTCKTLNLLIDDSAPVCSN